MERMPKYIFEAEKWKPKLANDGRPSGTWLFDSWGNAIKTWWTDDRAARKNIPANAKRPNFTESAQALIDILKATDAKNTAQAQAWWENLTEEEKKAMNYRDYVR